jgi:hypothetical protein
MRGSMRSMNSSSTLRRNSLRICKSKSILPACIRGSYRYVDEKYIGAPAAIAEPVAVVVEYLYGSHVAII